MMAIAFGVDGPMIVWWKLSNRTKFFAQDHMNGMVSQSRWLRSVSPACFCARVTAVGAAPLEVTMGPPGRGGRQALLVHRVAVVRRDAAGSTSRSLAMP